MIYFNSDLKQIQRETFGSKKVLDGIAICGDRRQNCTCLGEMWFSICAGDKTAAQKCGLRGEAIGSWAGNKCSANSGPLSYKILNWKFYNKYLNIFQKMDTTFYISPNIYRFVFITKSASIWLHLAVMCSVQLQLTASCDTIICIITLLRSLILKMLLHFSCSCSLVCALSIELHLAEQLSVKSVWSKRWKTYCREIAPRKICLEN